MANGLIIPSEAVWKGAMVLGGVTFEGKFKVFNSKGGWAFLFGKLLMQAACATHDFETDIVKLHTESGTITLTNQINEQAAEHVVTLGIGLTLDVKQWRTKKGGSSGQDPPLSRIWCQKQHPANNDMGGARAKDQHPSTKPTYQKEIEAEVCGPSMDSGEMGSIENTDENMFQTGGEDDTPMREVLLTTTITELPHETDTLTVQMNTPEPTNEDKDDTEQKEVDNNLMKEILIDIAADCLAYDTDDTNHYTSESKNLIQVNIVSTEANNIFTWHTDPFKTECITRILNKVTIGDDLTDEQWELTKAVIREFTDCFTLAMSEVNTIPSVSHQLKISPSTTFQTKISQQSMTSQCKYLNDKVDEMLAAGIIVPIHPHNVHNITPTILTQKVHEGNGLTLDKPKHHINDECINHGFPSAFDLSPRPER